LGAGRPLSFSKNWTILANMCGLTVVGTAYVDMIHAVMGPCMCMQPFGLLL
jgi:hypothetical protein